MTAKQIFLFEMVYSDLCFLFEFGVYNDKIIKLVLIRSSMLYKYETNLHSYELFVSHFQGSFFRAEINRDNDGTLIKNSKTNP